MGLGWAGVVAVLVVAVLVVDLHLVAALGPLRDPLLVVLLT